MEVVTQDPAPIKVGFSFAKPTTIRKKRETQEPDQKDYVTDIRGNQLRSLAPTKKAGLLVIPLESQQGNKRVKTTPKVTTQAASASTPASGPAREKTLDELAAEAVISDAKNEMTSVESDRVILPIILQNQIEGIESITDEDERFKYDVESRPDEAGMEEYENVPIEEFGKAMLRGMGWETGKAIGLNNRGLAEPIEFVARQGRLGLGATPETVEIKKKKYIKPGESREPKPTMVAPTGPDGKVRHVKRISEKLVPLKRDLVGRLAAIASGPHEGLYARVIQELPNDEVAVRLLASDEDVVVAKSDLNLSIVESNITEGHPAYKYISKEKEKSSSKSSSSSSSSSKSKSKSKSSKSKSKSSEDSPSWLFPNIMVRIVSKKLDGGKYYNKKGHIVDVVSRHKCIVQLADGSLVEGVKQKALETVIPRQGEKVKVVKGSKKGSVGKLLESKKNDKNVECGVVQFSSDLTIGIFELDDIAGYNAPDHGDYMDIM